LVERLELPPVRPDAAADLEDALRRHGTLRLDPGEQAGAARHVLAADLEHVLEAGGGDERGRSTLALQDEVGRDRRAVEDAGDIAAGKPRDLQHLGNAVAETAGGVVRRRRRLRGPEPSGGGIEQRDVGERAARVDADDDARLWLPSSHQASTS